MENAQTRDPFVEIIQIEFDRKRERNPSYSIRSFSRDLQIDASNLAKILSHKKKVGKLLRTRIATNLGFNQEEISQVLSGLDSRTANSHYTPHSLEVFQIISQWQHYAILELVKIKSNKVSPAFIGQRLGISPKLAEASMKRLRQVGLLRINKKSGRLEASDEASSSISFHATSKAHREQQKQILEGAIMALDQTPIELRSQSSVTMAIDVDKLDEARRLIKDFRRSLGRLLSSTNNLTEVYQLSVSLYPVTKELKEKKQ